MWEIIKHLKQVERSFDTDGTIMQHKDHCEVVSLLTYFFVAQWVFLISEPDIELKNSIHAQILACTSKFCSCSFFYPFRYFIISDHVMWLYTLWFLEKCWATFFNDHEWWKKLVKRWCYIIFLIYLWVLCIILLFFEVICFILCGCW